MSTSASSATGPITARGRRTRDAILDAAAELFLRLGVHATSVEDILEASGTGKGQLYHYFGSKEGLVRAVLRDRADRYFETHAPLLDDLDSWDGLGRWFDAILRAHDRPGCHGCLFGMLASELADHDPELRAELDRFFDRWRGHLARGLAAMRSSGLLRPEADPEALSLLALAAAQGGFLLAKASDDVRPARLALDQVLSYFKSLSPASSCPTLGPG
ncbi:TetR/AcrR family transcriptional regulator [Tautonia sociabilis]|uniref:TetR/AcrR family transcriptional regulator n=1 Tax=Tautonia sociabilis TaxID=2080755 RepID=A0A432MN46_9BACT|nr:TetR/AcrR family transcriptional regulator [Tautonia sociabilis]RUL88525.1 TetR/AcrR family transcriptional regulator [Tautonia sociabilis]